MQQDADRQHDGQPAPDEVAEHRSISTGRNLPAAIGVGLLLGGLVVLTLFTVKATFLLYVGIIVAVALWELSHALRTRDIHLPLIPIAVGGTAMVTLAYWTQTRWAVAALALAAIGVLGWRLPGGADGYVRDVTAGIFTLMYLPLMAMFVSLMLVEPDGARRALIFVVLTVCSDTGGYLAGILFGKHPLAPAISPKKTWEGLAGSIALCLVAGAIMVPRLLSGHVWQGATARPGRSGRGHPWRPGRVDDQAGPPDQGHGSPAARTRRRYGPNRFASGNGPRDLAAARAVRAEWPRHLTD